MRRCYFILLILAGLAPALRGQYRDHRVANVDSLENVIAGWTPERLATASYGERSRVAFAFRDLMWGYSVVNGERSLYMARRLAALAREENWLYSIYDAEKMIGQHFWAGGQPDSAAAHFRRSLEAVERMRAGETNAENPEGYDTVRVDDAYSSLCGAIGNLYNTMDSIPTAMEYYAKAGEIFEKYGWKQSSAVLYHNLGETWLDEGDLRQAKECYGESLRYAREAEDSLMVADALVGLAQVAVRRGRLSKALGYVRTADEYYSQHQDREPGGRIELLDVTDRVLSRQKRQRGVLALVALALLVLAGAFQVLWERLRRLRREKEAADEVIDEAIAALSPAAAPGADDATGGAAEGWTDGEAEDGKPFLSAREREILPLIAAGLTSPQIAEKLFLSLPTIKWYRRKLLEKFDAANSADLIARAKERGLV